MGEIRKALPIALVIAMTIPAVPAFAITREISTKCRLYATAAVPAPQPKPSTQSIRDQRAAYLKCLDNPAVADQAAPAKTSGDAPKVQGSSR